MRQSLYDQITSAIRRWTSPYQISPTPASLDLYLILIADARSVLVVYQREMGKVSRSLDIATLVPGLASGNWGHQLAFEFERSLFWMNTSSILHLRSPRVTSQPLVQEITLLKMQWNITSEIGHPDSDWLEYWPVACVNLTNLMIWKLLESIYGAWPFVCLQIHPDVIDTTEKNWTGEMSILPPSWYNASLLYWEGFQRKMRWDFMILSFLYNVKS